MRREVRDVVSERQDCGSETFECFDRGGIDPGFGGLIKEVGAARATEGRYWRAGPCG